MAQENDAIVSLLTDIKKSLSHIELCFEEQFLEIQNNKIKEKYDELIKLINTEPRKIAFQLLFNDPPIPQTKISEEAHISQPAVSNFIRDLLEKNLIEKHVDEQGNAYYKDIYSFKELLK